RVVAAVSATIAARDVDVPPLARSASGPRADLAADRKAGAAIQAILGRGAEEAWRQIATHRPPELAVVLGRRHVSRRRWRLEPLELSPPEILPAAPAVP